MPRHDGPSRSHSGERFPLGKLPRERMDRPLTQVGRRVVKKRATRKTRYHKVDNDG